MHRLISTMVTLRPTTEQDAPLLFPLIYRSPVTDNLIYDGPESLEDYSEGMAGIVAKGHVFTILIEEEPAGTIDVRPYADGYRADIGLWLGERFEGRGAGTKSIQLICRYAFAQLPLEKLEATIFEGNHASRRAFEKNGFQLEGTIRMAVRKRGVYRHEWILGLLRSEWTGAL